MISNLSPLEEKVLKLARDGMRQVEIAERLGYTRQYINIIFRRLGINALAVAKQKALEAGAEILIAPIISKDVLQVVEMFAAGVPRTEIYEKVSYSRRRVDQIIHRYFTSETRKKAREAKPTLTKEIRSRLEKGMRPHEVAKELNISQQTVYNVGTSQMPDYIPSFPREEQQRHKDWMERWLIAQRIRYEQVIPHRNNKYTIFVGNLAQAAALASKLRGVYPNVSFDGIEHSVKMTTKHPKVTFSAYFGGNHNE